MGTNRNVLVILGAGASHDCVREGMATTNEVYRPPLTPKIFSSSDHAEALLQNFRGAGALSGTIVTEVARGTDLEVVLAQLASARDNPRARQFMEILPFLQQLFFTISERFTRRPINYLTLVDTLFSAEAAFDQIVFVTLNYDLILDKVLEPDYMDGPISAMSFYLSSRCTLIKLHGSANWARAISAGNQAGYLDTIRSLDTGTGLGTEIVIAPHPGSMAEPNSVYYPALSVPLGTYAPVCPVDHVDRLKALLPTCRHILVIGCSGKDEDLLGLLRNHLPQFAFTFYLVGSDDATIVEDRFSEGVRNLKIAIKKQVFEQGFSQFLIDGGLRSFVRDAMEHER